MQIEHFSYRRVPPRASIRKIFFHGNEEIHAAKNQAARDAARAFKGFISVESYIFWH